MIVFALIFYSCAKEELIPTAASARLTTETDKPLESGPSVTSNSQALKVAISGFTCEEKGEWLLVYNPNDPNLNFYGSGEFAIRWFKDGIPFEGTNRLDCVCRGRYSAMVRHIPSQRHVGIADYSVTEDCSTSDDGTNN